MEIARVLNSSISCIDKLSSPSTYLCFNCQRLLIKRDSLERQLMQCTLNIHAKLMLRNLKSSINPPTAQRAAKGLGVVQKVCTQFTSDNNFKENKDFHTIPSIKKDLDCLIKQLTESGVFEVKLERCHYNYNNYKLLFHSLNWSNIDDWIKEKILDYN